MMLVGDTSLVDTTLCLHNAGAPREDDRAKDCWEYAFWHIAYADNTQTQCCDGHLGRALAWREMKSMHEFGASCNLPGSWFDIEMGGCYTTERGVELGRLAYVKEET